jgi:hypothetical protein
MRFVCNVCVWNMQVSLCLGVGIWVGVHTLACLSLTHVDGWVDGVYVSVYVYVEAA